MRRLSSLVLVLAAVTPAAPADTYEVSIAPSALESGEEAISGRLILFFVTRSGGRWESVRPMTGPFWEAPQPIASIEVKQMEPGDVRRLTGGTEAVFPTSFDHLEGRVRVQVILDRDNTERAPADGPGNLYSEVRTIELSRDHDELVKLVLTRRVRDKPLPRDTAKIGYLRLRSELLSAFYGRDVFHRVGVAYPRGYNRAAASEGPRWPAIYVIPAFGDRHTYARRVVRQLRSPDAPRAVHIVPDPESPLGHHGFVDSPNHGPRGTALVKELIPYLERELHLLERPEGRVVTGHSSGGWSSLWLQLQWPEVFGACFSSAPDPVDFSAFQLSDLYEQDNLYRLPGGGWRPSYRSKSAINMTVRQECSMEYAIHPFGGSGEQWDTWEAMFSPADPTTGYPKPMFDARTGVIDHEVVEHWSSFDVASMVMQDWATYGPVLTGKVRLVVGSEDSFYLERAVESLVEKAKSLPGWGQGDGYVRIVEGADHSTVHRFTGRAWPAEMSRFLEGSLEERR